MRVTIYDFDFRSSKVNSDLVFRRVSGEMSIHDGKASSESGSVAETLVFGGSIESGRTVLVRPRYVRDPAVKLPVSCWCLTPRRYLFVSVIDVCRTFMLAGDEHRFCSRTFMRITFSAIGIREVIGVSALRVARACVRERLASCYQTLSCRHCVRRCDLRVGRVKKGSPSALERRSCAVRRPASRVVRPAHFAVRRLVRPHRARSAPRPGSKCAPLATRSLRPLTRIVPPWYAGKLILDCGRNEI